MPNYFGPQRFGREQGNLTRARCWAEGGAAPRDRVQRGFALSAARSEIFNRVVDERVRRGDWNRLLLGEAVMLDGRRSFFAAPEIDALLDDRCRRMDVHPSGPLWGRGESAATGAAREVEDAIVGSEPGLARVLESERLEQERRSLRLPVRSLRWTHEAGALLMDSSCQGTFATAVLHELLGDAWRRIRAARTDGSRGLQYSAATFLPVPRLRILVSNDDGYRAEGLQHLADALRPLSEVTVVAPDRNRSGASNSLTLDVPVRVSPYGERMYYVNGTPTDCVHLAISGLFDFEHDMVVSGINDGANLGDDVLYSGTVAAAVEGRFLGLPTMAVSLVVREGRHFETAARVAGELVARVLRSPLESSMILNVNVPDVPYEHLRGTRVTRLGHRHRSEAVVRATDPRGRPVYWVGPAGEGAERVRAPTFMRWPTATSR